MMARYRVVPRRVIPADYITDLKQRIDNLRRAVLQKNEEIERLREAIRALVKDRAEAVKQREDLEREKQAIAKEKADLEAIKKDRERLTADNLKLNESINALQSRISMLEAQLSEYEERIRDYESSIGQNKEHAAGLEATIKQKDEEVSRLNEMISGHLSTIAELTETLNEKEKVIAEKDSTINEYMEKTSELDRYLLEFRELKISERMAAQLSRATLILGVILGIAGAVFAIFAEPLVFSAGIANALRVKMAVTMIGLALPLGLISVTYRLFATRQSVLYLNVTGLVVAASTLVLFDLYYPEGFVHPFAGTLYFLYALAIVMHFTAVLLALPKVRSGIEASRRGKVGFPYGGEMGALNAAKPEIPSEEENKSEEVQREIGEEDEEDLFKPIG